MIAPSKLLTNFRNTFECVAEILRYALTFLWALLCPKAVLAARLLAVQSQLAVCKRRIHEKKDPRPQFTRAFRVLWVSRSKVLDKWEDCAQLMRPATVKKWHRIAFRVF